MSEQHQENSKAIRALIQNARKGNVLSIYQLYENHLMGNNTPRNEEQAEKYLMQLSEQVAHASPCVKSLELQNFRRFRQLHITFASEITVIIGDNGVGKTSIAEALSYALSLLSRNVKKRDVNDQPIKGHDVNVDAKDFAQVITKFELNPKTPFDISFKKPVPGYSQKALSSYIDAKTTGNIYRALASATQVSLPFFAFYSVQRAGVEFPETLQEKAAAENIDSRFNALTKVPKASSQLDAFTQHYIELVNLAESEEADEIKDARNKVTTLESLAGKFTESDNGAATIGEEIIAAREQLESLEQKQVKHYANALLAVNKALETMVPGIADIQVDRSSGKPKIMLRNFGTRLNLTQLSQGQKTFLALAGDIALRMVILNPLAQNPLASGGIVIIDEIELHLHAKWQQTVAQNLQNTFPGLQFILTTHSPQVLSTVDKKCIRQISCDANGQLTVKTPEFQTKGVISADILDRIMETNPTPQTVEQAGWFTEFARCLELNQKSEMEQIFSKIVEYYGKQHPVVIDCESKIRIFEMKMRMRKGNDAK